MDKAFDDKDKILRYVTAGNATFTVYSAKTQQCYTYQFKKMKDSVDFEVYLKPNEYTSKLKRFLGYLLSETEQFRIADNSSELSMSIRTLLAFLAILINNEPLPSSMIFRRSRFCCKCGRRIKDEESIAVGIGSSCREKEKEVK